jgi:hypothetical protein
VHYYQERRDINSPFWEISLPRVPFPDIFIRTYFRSEVRVITWAGGTSAGIFSRYLVWYPISFQSEFSSGSCLHNNKSDLRVPANQKIIRIMRLVIPHQHIAECKD